MEESLQALKMYTLPKGHKRKFYSSCSLCTVDFSNKDAVVNTLLRNNLAGTTSYHPLCSESGHTAKTSRKKSTKPLWFVAKRHIQHTPLQYLC
jgi:hypothetical protein